MRGLLSRSICIVAVATTILCGTGNAAVIFSNGLPNQTLASDLNLYLQADNFSLLVDSDVTLIRFWTLQESLSDYAGTTEYSIRDDDAGQPGAIVESGSFVSTQTPTGNSAQGLPEFEHVGLVNFSLGAGDYWLVLHNGPSSSEPATSFYWAFTDDQAGDSESAELALGGTDWVTNGAELAFQLEGDATAIPEPSTLLLSAAGIALVAFRRVYRRSR